MSQSATFQSLFKSLILLGFAVQLMACASLGEPQSSVKGAQQVTATQSLPATQDFDPEKDTLQDLLIAEVALQRNEVITALVNYLNQARMTRDLNILKRAISVAQYAKDSESIIELGKLWLEIEPDSINAHQMLSFQFSYLRDYEKTFEHVEALIALGQDPQASGIAINARNLKKEHKETLKSHFEQASEKFPDNDDLLYGRAVLERDLERRDRSLSLLNTLLARNDKHMPSKVLKASLLKTGDLDTALRYTRQVYNEHPHDHNLGRIFAGLLIDAKDFDSAEDVFRNLIEQYPQVPTLELSLALVMLENEKEKEAEDIFRSLIDKDIHLNESHYYLGRIADHNERTDEAIDYYLQVKQGLHFISAIERSSYLLTQNEREDEAFERLATLRETYPKVAEQLWLTELKVAGLVDGRDELIPTILDRALADFPNNVQLLYARAMLFEDDDNLVAMERDLRQILETDPEHAVALNALGYTLADRTDRLEEALMLITKALQIEPQNAAIIDSMGWVLYRLGKPREALPFVFKAFELFPDPEVAAHLGELLWQLGQREKANSVWQAAYDKYPDHETLIDTLRSFDHPILLPSETSEPAASQNAGAEAETETPQDPPLPSADNVDAND